MYRQVLIDPSQTALQRILWRDSIDQPIRSFELLTVTYGTTSAAFLAIRSLRKLAKDGHAKFPIGARTVLNDFYVDDLVSGADTLQEAIAIKKETSQLLLESLFELCKWTSNEPILRSEQCLATQKEFISSNDKNCEVRTLGLTWNCTSDEFIFSSIACPSLLTTPTKRSILSRIALIFDPLGLLGPATVTAKIIIQKLWILRVDWDESLPLDIDSKWRQYEAELPALRDIVIPRRVVAPNEDACQELHGFADASEVAYGACIYLRTTDVFGVHSTRLLCAKNRVAPLKNLSIPRLELCAALLLARLTDKMTKCLKRKIEAVFLWTDSTIVLAWLQSLSRTWTPFVANRVGEIQQLTTIHNWYHINSQDNPADVLSRGVMPASLLSSSLWWTGPPWLTHNKENWPQLQINIDTRELPEHKSTVSTTLIAQDSSFDIFARFSKLMKLLRVVAYIYRFYSASRKKSDISQPKATYETLSISSHELQLASQVLVRMVQGSHFSKELKTLSNQQTLDRNSPILRLNPFLDQTGIMRVGGRLKFSNLSYNAKHPIILPGRHPFSRLIIKHEHERHFHAGPQATLSAIRQNYWLVASRDAVRQFTRKCVTCFRHSPTPASAIMGNLPKSRITVPNRAFERCGVDYAGPFYYKDGSKRTAKLLKCYMAIFVCLATTAVHIELAADLTSQAFLNVLKRFISRRGNPSDIYSDNGLNFVGSNRELSELTTLFCEQENQHQIIDFAATKNINWHFIPPRAPHHGGIWEAAVKGAKRHLSKITKEAHLKYEELETLLIQVEAILNSRPLTPMSSDPSDLTSLTPGHFLIGCPMTSYPEPSLQELAINRLSRWQYVERLRQHFWRRWSLEYLHHCQQRSRWRTNEPSLCVGQLVILREDQSSPMSWPLARIVEIHPGIDNVVRIVTVRTTKGIYKRPITRLCLLPFENN